MELFVVGALIATAMGLFIYKSYQLALLAKYPLPGDELKWKRSPYLPFQELSGKLRTKKTTAKKKNQRFESEPLARAEIPLESISIEERTSSVTPPPHTFGRTSTGTDV